MVSGRDRRGGTSRRPGAGTAIRAWPTARETGIEAPQPETLPHQFRRLRARIERPHRVRVVTLSSRRQRWGSTTTTRAQRRSTVARSRSGADLRDTRTPKRVARAVHNGPPYASPPAQRRSDIHCLSNCVARASAAGIAAGARGRAPHEARRVSRGRPAGRSDPRRRRRSLRFHTTGRRGRRPRHGQSSAFSRSLARRFP